MRDIGTILRRVMVDLSITEDEAKVAHIYLDCCLKRQKRFITWLGVLCAMLLALVATMWGGRAIGWL